MVQAGEQEHEGSRAKLFSLKEVFKGAGRHSKSLNIGSQGIQRQDLARSIPLLSLLVCKITF